MNYETELCREEHFPQVIDLVKYFSGGDLQRASDHFHWKYLENPFKQGSPGFVATHNGRVIGFRGNLLQKWQIPWSQKTFSVLVTGDNIVHRDHRRKGISTRMRKQSLTAYGADYRFFLSLSSNARSAHIHRKFGAVGIADRSCLSRYGLGDMMRFVLNSAKKAPVAAKPILGRFGEVLASDRWFPREMALIAADLAKKSTAFTLVQDEAFFRWRFKNPRYSYFFYYHLADDSMVGYLVVRLSKRGQRGFIFDYGAPTADSYEKLLQCAIESTRVHVLSIWDTSLQGDLHAALRRLGFKKKGLLPMLGKRLGDDIPILVRPMGETPGEDDWHIDGLDVRKSTSWHIKQICSDAL